MSGHNANHQCHRPLPKPVWQSKNISLALLFPLTELTFILIDAAYLDWVVITNRHQNIQNRVPLDHFHILGMSLQDRNTVILTTIGLNFPYPYRFVTTTRGKQRARSIPRDALYFVLMTLGSPKELKYKHLWERNNMGKRLLKIIDIRWPRHVRQGTHKGPVLCTYLQCWDTFKVITDIFPDGSGCIKTCCS